MELRRRYGYQWEIPRTGEMRVPGIVFVSEALMEQARRDRALEQVANVAHLPGIVGASFAMPDIHWGYGFPIGGVAATDVERGGVVSPGGVGFDIGCGVRLLSSHLTEADFARYGVRIMARLDPRIPRGTGKGGIAAPDLLDGVLEHGARAALNAGFGVQADLDRCEEEGTSAGARPDLLSPKALKRGGGQIGSLGAGNHFLEIQVVDKIIDPATAEVFGLRVGTLTVMIHCGSRGLGHQTCQDHLEKMDPAMARHNIQLPDRQLACVPVDSAEGRAYLGAMAAAANFSWANRHILAHEARQAFAAVLGVRPDDLGLDLVFDVAHNLAKLETHTVDGEERLLCVHRKGATRAFGPGHPDIPEDLRAVGQPVLVPGSMGTASWVMRGVTGNPAFDSSAHGAGRLLSRSAARRQATGAEVRREMERAGIAISPGSAKLLAEEAPYAYKDVDEVARVCEAAGLAARVARLRPLGVVKA
ncbi:MAG: RtcB family protein [Actinomycetota bacterium]|nr:RtcB family protein [Actinomycetota bacterium]MDK1038354.1 RtcB family protein [Actinomycetota bacterium]